MKTEELNEIEVKDLLKGEKKAVLLHKDKRYQLSITKRGKLILTAAEQKNQKGIFKNKNLLVDRCCTP